MKKLCNSRGFIDYTLLFLILGISALAIPTITKNLPTYTSQIAQTINNDSSARIAEEGIEFSQEGEFCRNKPCDPNYNLICGGAGAGGAEICVKRGSLSTREACHVYGVGLGNEACSSGKCVNIGYTIGRCALSASEPAPKELNGMCYYEGGKFTCNDPYVCDNNISTNYPTGKCIEKGAASTPGVTNPPAAVPLPNPPTNTKAITYCNNGKINADITFSPSSNAASHKVSYSFVNNPLTSKFNPVNNALTVTNVSKNFKFNFTSYACNSAGDCIEDQNGYYSINIGDPCNATQGTLTTIIKIEPNGTEYKQVTAAWNAPDGVKLNTVQPNNSTNTYTFSGPSKVGTHNLRMTVSKGTTEFKKLDESYTVTEGNTTTKNVTITLGGNNTGGGNSGGNLPPNSGGVNETGVCAGKGGLDISYTGYSSVNPGYMGPRCSTPASENGKFDAVTAATKAFCGKTYADAWKCKDGSTAYSVYPSNNTCTTSTAWCPTGSGGNTTTTPGVTNSAAKQGTFNAVVRVVANGANYNEVGIAWVKPDGSVGGTIQSKKASHIYTFSVPAQVGTINVSAAVFNADDQLIKDSAETCRNTGGSGPHDCKITVTEGATTTQNFVMSLDPEQTTPGGTTPIPTTGTTGPGTGEACTPENTICGGSNSNSCLKAKDNDTLHCCRFTERFCAALNRCVNGGTIEFQNCGKVFNTPTPTAVGAFNPATCNGAPGSANNHCNGKNAAGDTLPCCPGYHCNGNPSSSTTACVKDTAAASSSQTIASESECSKNSDCKKFNKNACVLNVQEVGTCK